MADGRRLSNPPPHQPGQIPQAPPLPPRSTLQRLAAQLPSLNAARPQSLNAGRPDGLRSRVAPSLPIISGIDALSSQDATHKTGLEIWALDINHDRTQAILAGRDILKTVSVHGTRCSEALNLRSAVINYASHNARGSARHRETLDIHDVKWSHGNCKNFVATAATNGKIVLYDLNKAGIEVARLHEHHRQVHRLAFNPFQPSSLLSASQDGTVRWWDLRDLSRQREVVVCRSRQAYHGQSEGVRDVRWSPTNGEQFAFCTDNGAIQKWEVRNPKAPLLRINAHDKLCHAIDWHPDGRHVLSASADKTVKVWDFASDQRRQKATWTLRTPYPVSNVRWRPPCRSSDSRDPENGPWQCTQFATTFEKHAQVLVWDFRRPYIPFREIVRGTSPPSDMLWHSQHLLWTVGREGIFAQSDVHYAPKVLDRRNMQALAVSPTGEVSAFSQKRAHRRDRLFDRQAGLSTSADGRDSFGTADPAIIGSLSRSSADDTMDDSFLSSSQRKHHGRTLSNRSTKSFSSTPPSEDIPIKDLQEALKELKAYYKPQQVAFRGSLETAIDPAVFTFLAQKYKHHSHGDAHPGSIYQDAHRLFTLNAEYAQRASFYRIAQSFRILGSTIQHQMQRRAESVRQRRISHGPKKSSQEIASSPGARKTTDLETPNGSRPATQSSHAVISPLRAKVESTSNAATPLARPHNNGTHTHRAIPSLSELDDDVEVALPPPIAGPSSMSPEDRRVTTDQKPEFNGPYWYNTSGDLNERRAALKNYRQPPKAPLNLDTPGITSPQTRPINIPPPLDRHNSDDSFAMFSTSTDSRGISVPGSLTSPQSFSKQPDPVLERWQNIDSVSSSGAWQSDSDKASGDMPASGTADQQVWAEAESSGPSSDSTDSPIKSDTRVEDKVRFLEPARTHAEDAQPTPAMEAANDGRNPRLIKEDSMSFSAAFGSSFSGTTSSQPSHGTWSTSNTSSSQFDALKASGTIVPDNDDRLSHSIEDRRATNGTDHDTTVAREYQKSDSRGFILSGILSKDKVVDDPDAPFSIAEMLNAMLDYHTSILSDAQTTAQFLLLLAPLLPHSKPVQDDVVKRTFIIYEDTMNSLGLTADTVQRDMSRSLEHMLDSGLHPLQVESILSTYHEQLVSLNLLNAAVNLRRLCYPAFPAVYEQSIKDASLGLRCQGCRNPLNNPNGKLRCEHCSQRQAPCPICWCDSPAIEYPAPKAKKTKRRKSRTRASSLAASTGTSLNADLAGPVAAADPERRDIHADQHRHHHHLPNDDDDAASPVSPTVAPTHPPPALWLTCPLCNHSAHLSCFSAWLASTFSPGDLAEGACPTPSCTCDCAPGAVRDEAAARIEQRVAQRERERGREGRAVRDDWRAPESRAVSQVRGLMDSTGSLASRDGRPDRRVRLLEPEEYAAQAAPRPRRHWVMGN